MKKLIPVILALACAVTCALALTACGDENKEVRYYYTVSAPEHCNVSANGSTDEDGKTYVIQGSTLQITLSIEKAYESDAILTLTINGQSTAWTTYDTDSAFYSIDYTPSEDCAIVIGGTIIEKYCDVTFKLTDYAVQYGYDYEGVYIRFAGGQSSAFSTYFTGEPKDVSVKYGEKLEFWLYTLNYTANPNFGGLYINEYKAEFYHSNGEYGYHFCTEIYYDAEIYLQGKDVIGVSIWTSEYGALRMVDFPNDTWGHNIKFAVDENCTALTIEIYDDESGNMAAALQQLVLKINGETIQHTFTSGVNTIPFDKLPYQYNDGEFPYEYNIRLNHYTLDYFSES